jgi:putative transposase
MGQIFHGVCKSFAAQLVEFDGEKDHVHLLVLYPPKVAIATLVNSLKGVSSRMLRKNFPLFKDLYRDNTLWSRSYFAASVGGAPIEILKQYIQNQISST